MCAGALSDTYTGRKWEGKGHRDDQGSDHAKPRNNLKDFEFYSLWNKEPLEGFKQDGNMIGNTFGEVK